MKRILASILVLSSLFGTSSVYGTEKATKAETKVEKKEEGKDKAISNTNKDDIDKYLKEGKYTILLLGIDGPTDDGQRSDTIMIAQFNKKTKEIRIISMPRDSYLDIPGHGFEKATHAFAYGGAELTQEMIANNLDLPLNGYMTLNFTTFPKFINFLGGVTLEISGEEAAIAIGNGEGGTYTLNGGQALTFGRIRKIDSDYMRTGRHRRLMKAILAKIKEFSPNELPELAKNFNGIISTNIDNDLLYTLGKYAYDNDFKIVDTLIPDEETSWGNTIDGAWVLEFDIEDAKAKMKDFFK